MVLSAWVLGLATGWAGLELATLLGVADADLRTWRCRLRSSYFRGKVVWITGASSGIGKALALALDRLDVGVKLVLSARRVDELEKVRRELKHAECALVRCDLEDLDSLDAVGQEALAAFGGRIDFLFNNGGISTRTFAQDTSFDVDVKVMTVDYLSHVKLAKIVLPGMVERKFGHIVNTSSLAGKVGSPLRSSYSGPKFAIIGHFDSLRIEVAPSNVHVTNVCPGSVQTDVAKNALLGSGEAFGSNDKNIANGMPVKRCAHLMLAAVSNNVPEAWMFGHAKEKIGAYLATYFPAIFKAITLRNAQKLVDDAKKIINAKM
ncbi:Dehydrogenase/reductase SDR family member 7 (Retinal short-chain dehydrogenase/reductase 4) (retSDR4) (Short chain dehydrogenase/reductase family 34C member 1) [Durusdinium trenchii]|uniref:Dehydrogenase/reductase SDR family member 7 (Retinal short-chain dehydrogenase/reductase 4) (RetSDR4) (Short chain dehydrogenase/reductase family 34C member 1) n=1 Tax=Durusdinium trenchii TaxID=1381693 RepID=A0ABP0LRI3_9DINO